MSKLNNFLNVVAPVIGVINSPRKPGEQISFKTAEELMKDFSNDEDAAGMRYNDKVIRVSGIIKSIQQNSGQTIFLSTSSALCSVICHFPENYTGQLNHLRPWHPVVVKGVCRGILKHVVLEECELEGVDIDML